MAAGRLCRPKAKSFWILVRRLLLRKSHRPPPAGGAEEDRREEKSGLLSRSSLEQLLGTDDDAAPGGDSDVCRCAKKHGQPVAVLLPGLARPEAAAAAASTAGARDGHRRFVFGGFRRRLLMRRPWRPMLVAIPE